MLCEQLGEEPDPAKMPLELSEFPEEVQVAFFMFGLLSDRFDGMSGSYLGKYWDNLDHIFDLYEVDSPKEIHFFMKMYESIIVQYRFEQAERKRKAEKRKSAGGKNFAHNVQG